MPNSEDFTQKKSLNICFFNTSKSWGGGEKWHFDIASALYKQGYSILIVTNTHSKLKEKISATQIPLYMFRITHVSLLNPFKIFKLVKFLKRKNVETVILNLPSDLKAAGIAAKIAGVKNIIYRRGSDIPVKNTILNRFLYQKIITHVLTPSMAIQKSILFHNANLFPENKMHVIFNGIDPNEYIENQAIPPLYPNDNNLFIIGNLGRLVTQKGQHLLIDLAVRLREHGLHFKILIGGTGRLEKNLKRMATDAGVLESICFCGFIDNIPGFMNSIHVFALTSIWEGFGFVIAEAMFCKKPVIAFQRSSNTELINHGRTGFLIEYPDMDKFSETIIQLYKHSDLRDTIGYQGYRHAMDHFTIDNTISQVKDFIHSLNIKKN